MMTNPEPAGWHAIVAFNVPERMVDQLIDDAVQDPSLPKRWFVFGRDMGLMRALDTQWANSVELIHVLLPPGDLPVLDACLIVLENEAVPVERCIWIHGPGQVDPPPVEAGLVVPLEALGAGSIVDAVASANLD